MNMHRYSRWALLFSGLSMIAAFTTACEPAVSVDDVADAVEGRAASPRLDRLENFLKVKYGVTSVVIEQPKDCASSEDGRTRYGSRFSVVTKAGDVFTGFGCHEDKSPNWEVVLDAAPILLKSRAPAPAPAPAPVQPAPTPVPVEPAS